MTTISTSTTLGIVLNPATYTNPVVITAGITIANNGGGDAVSGNHGASGHFVIQNDGTIAGSGAGARGVYLSPGGSVTNATSASISGYGGVGVYGAAGTVVNDGSIAGTGGKGRGVDLNAGGSVSNGTAASISGFDGVFVLGGVGTLVNDGGIAGTELGVYLFSGGTVTNAAAASIDGSTDGILVAVGAGTVVNDGSVAGTGANGIGVQLNTGGQVSNTVSASMTGVYEGVELGASGTVDNHGGIAATGTSGSGVVFDAGGSLINAASASIGGAFGVAVFGGAGTVANSGSIESTGTYARGGGYAGGIGVYVRSGGSVTNAAAASIVGSAVGVGISGGSGGVVVNNGTIAGTGTAGIGVALYSGGSVTNSASASITGGNFGVDLVAGGTLTNAGTIDGPNSVLLGGTGNNLLVLEPGFAFSGLVTGSASASNTLELASAASAGVVSGLGTEFTGFGAITFDAGARWSITGDTAGLAGTISGFAVGDTIELTGVTETGTAFVGNTLTLTEAVGFATLDLPGIASLADLAITSNADGTEVTVVPCFAGGTGIACPDGERAVETLVPGELVRLVGGKCAAIAWIGHRRVDCTRHPRPGDVWPVRVLTGAFGTGVPHRDLSLSPDHAVFFDGSLIPIRYLINGRTVVQERVDTVTYYHVELPAHGVVLADGLPCESYLDTGNRGAFANGRVAGDGGAAAPIMLHADFALRIWATKACAELIVDGPKLAAAKRVLLARAEALGHRVIADPDLRVIVDGRALPPRIAGTTWSVRLPPDARNVRLVSRNWVPGHVLPDNPDARPLGVAIANVRLDGGTLTLQDPRLRSGWHAVEAAGSEDAAATWRWTDGDAGLTVAEARELAFDVVMTGSYWETTAASNRARAS